MFSVNYLREDGITPAMEKEVLRRLRKVVPKTDVVLIMDFGHGLLTPAIRDYLQKNARFLIVNCQTNSNNFAFNPMRTNKSFEKPVGIQNQKDWRRREDLNLRNPLGVNLISSEAH